MYKCLTKFPISHCVCVQGYALANNLHRTYNKMYRPEKCLYGSCLYYLFKNEESLHGQIYGLLTCMPASIAFNTYTYEIHIVIHLTIMNEA